MDVYSDVYWTTEFTLTEADLVRLAAYIDRSGRAQPLGTLARRIVNGRLRHGPDQSAPIGQLFGVDTAVKQWDPAAEWQIGDHVIVLRKPEDRFVAYVGEVQDVVLDERGPGFSRVDVFIPEENRVHGYGPMSADDPRRQTIMANIKYEVARKREALASQASDEAEAETVEIIMYVHGERIIEPLLQALSEDDRFVRLDGRYFLRSLALLPSESHLHQLAWSLLGESASLTTTDLLARTSDATGDEALFGLYLALRQHPEWFANAQPGKRPLWTLAGPPPGSFTPQFPAYDPDSYEMLCLPETEAPPNVVARLWETELLTAVVLPHAR